MGGAEPSSTSSDQIPGPTARLRFRQYQESDLPDVHEMFADPQARRFYPTMNEDGAARWIRWNLENYEGLGFGLWVVERLTDGIFLGDCGLTRQHVEGQLLLEVGYHLKADHRGRGYAAEAAQASLTFAFEGLDARLVCSIVDPDNEPSIQVAGQIHGQRREVTDGNGKTMLVFFTEFDP